MIPGFQFSEEFQILSNKESSRAHEMKKILKSNWCKMYCNKKLN